MLLPFDLRVFPGDDPLDRLPARARYLLVMSLTAVVTAALVYLINDAFGLVDFHGWPLKVVEIVGFPLLAAALFVALRRSNSTTSGRSRTAGAPREHPRARDFGGKSLRSCRSTSPVAAMRGGAPGRSNSPAAEDLLRRLGGPRPDGGWRPARRAHPRSLERNRPEGFR